VSDQRIIDADCHVLEPKDIWQTWLSKKYQDKAPKLVKDEEGGDAWLHAGSAVPDPIGLVSTPGRPYDDFRWTGVTYEQARPGCYDGLERLRDMDIDGVHAELLFAPQRTIWHFLGDPDDDFVRAGLDAYHNFLFDQFCAVDPSRLLGVGQIPSTGVDDGIEALGKLKARGAKAVVISNWPSGGETISDDDDAFWAAAADHDMPVCVHIQIDSRRARQVEWAAQAVKPAGAVHLGGVGTSDLGERARARAVGNLGSVFAQVARTIGQFIFTGVLERFPTLHVAFVETGVGWIPHLLEQFDDRYWRNRSWGQLPISEPPSFYWHRNMSGTIIIDRSGIALRHAVGVDNIMWSSDYPHHGNDWPYSRRVIDDTMGQIDRSERARIVGGNAVRVFHLEPG
jgi:predicted TIM-barrel fold metal-dependent hydrolase